MTVRFHRHTTLHTEPAEAFDVSLDVDLHLRSMRDANETVLGARPADPLTLGDTITWRARHFGIWWTMTSVITEYDRPDRFVDEQLHGPFQRFRHIHLFTAGADQTTTMTDIVEFSAPLGPLGWLAERLVLGRYIPTLIDLRNDELTRHFAADES